MQRLLMLFVLMIQLPFGGNPPAPIAVIPPPGPLPFGGSPNDPLNQDRWVNGIGDLQVLVDGAVYQAKLQQNLAQPNGDSFLATGSAAAFNRSDAETRVSAFIHDLCARDPLYCNVSMAVHRVRFIGPPNPFVPPGN